MTDRLLLDTHAALRLDGGDAHLAAAIRADRMHPLGGFGPPITAPDVTLAKFNPAPRLASYAAQDGLCRVSSFRARIGPSGRLVIPAAQRRELGLEIGDEVVRETAGDELRVSSLKRRIARVQALVRKHNPRGESLSDSLLRDRRVEQALD